MRIMWLCNSRFKFLFCMVIVYIVLGDTSTSKNLSQDNYINIHQTIAKIKKPSTNKINPCLKNVYFARMRKVGSNTVLAKKNRDRSSIQASNNENAELSLNLDVYDTLKDLNEVEQALLLESPRKNDLEYATKMYNLQKLFFSDLFDLKIENIVNPNATQIIEILLLYRMLKLRAELAILGVEKVILDNEIQLVNFHKSLVDPNINVQSNKLYNYVVERNLTTTTLYKQKLNEFNELLKEKNQLTNKNLNT